MCGRGRQAATEGLNQSHEEFQRPAGAEAGGARIGVGQTLGLKGRLCDVREACGHE